MYANWDSKREPYEVKVRGVVVPFSYVVLRKFLRSPLVPSAAISEISTHPPYREKSSHNELATLDERYPLNKQDQYLSKVGPGFEDSLDDNVPTLVSYVHKEDDAEEENYEVEPMRDSEDSATDCAMTNNDKDDANYPEYDAAEDDDEQT
ncbi:hypothetical protein K7X08_023220 [Anisodus acutangulus]|uniref:Uncharacterized protein n=1 Tax=Anisodus acutangulus TaxID=402998 RepID=A0A9Q1QZ62_9SOLA|nr:hypothetical protein K7X08_023220 [Anisodus acutangulus]